MKLVLHIGTEKTGTTSFQVWVQDNRDILRSEGVWPAQTLNVPNNVALPVFARDADKREDSFLHFGIESEEDHAAFRAKVRVDLLADIAEAREAGMRIFLISSEQLQSRLFTLQMVERVAKLLKPQFEEISVICFLRPQVDTAISLSSTGSRVGLKIQHQQFEMLDAKGHYYNFKGLLDRWASAFGKDNVLPVPFKRNKNSVAFFREFMGLTREDYAPEQRMNTALDYRAIALTNQIRMTRFLENGRINPNRQFYVEDLPFDKPLTLSRDFAIGVHERFVEMNRELSEIWPQITERDLTPDWDRYPEVGTLDLIDDCDLGPTLQFVVQRFNADLHLARAQIDYFKARALQKDGALKRAERLLKQGRDKLDNAACFEPAAERAAELGREFDRATDKNRELELAQRAAKKPKQKPLRQRLQSLLTGR